jgi:hypothetical protein
MDYRKNLPYSTVSLVLGIISIPTCFCYGIVGLVCGILAIKYGNKAIKMYKYNPEEYSSGSIGNAKAGKICGIVGLILSILFFLYMLVVILIYGVAISAILSNLPN